LWAMTLASRARGALSGWVKGTVGSARALKFTLRLVGTKVVTPRLARGRV
jgi:hypothetical protein